MKTAFRNILILVLITGTLAVIYWLIINYYDDKNRTDDAQVDAHLYPVSARVSGLKAGAPAVIKAPATVKAA